MTYQFARYLLISILITSSFQIDASRSSLNDIKLCKLPKHAFIDSTLKIEGQLPYNRQNNVIPGLLDGDNKRSYSDAREASVACAELLLSHAHTIAHRFGTSIKSCKAITWKLCTTQTFTEHPYVVQPGVSLIAQTFKDVTVYRIENTASLPHGAIMQISALFLLNTKPKQAPEEFNITVV